MSSCKYPNLLYFNYATGVPTCSLERPNHKAIVTDTFQPFGNDSYIFSAYLDRRTNVIIVVAILHFNFSSDLIQCSVWYDIEEQPEVTNVTFGIWDRIKWYC